MATQKDNPYKRSKKALGGKKLSGEEAHEMMKRKASGPIKHTGKFQGKSNALGHGGRAAQMRARGVPGGVIGAIARREGAAPGGPNYHGTKKKAAISKQNLAMAMKKKASKNSKKKGTIGSSNVERKGKKAKKK